VPGVACTQNALERAPNNVDKSQAAATSPRIIYIFGKDNNKCCFLCEWEHPSKSRKKKNAGREKTAAAERPNKRSQMNYVPVHQLLKRATCNATHLRSR